MVNYTFRRYAALFGPSSSCSTLGDKSGNMFNFCGNTSSNRAGAWSHHVFSLIFPTTHQFHSFSMVPRTSPITASGATNVKNVIRFARQCKFTFHITVQTVSHLVPVIDVQPPQATAPVTSSSHTDTERSTLYLLWTSPTAEHLTSF